MLQVAISGKDNPEWDYILSALLGDMLGLDWQSVSEDLGFVRIC